MLKRVTLALDSVDAASWTQHDVENICEFLKTKFPVFPDTGRIYHGEVCQENDVTPASEEDIARLLELPGPFFVVIYPGWAALPYIFAAVLTVAAYVLTPSPVIPPPLAAARNSQAASPNNELSDRSNRARINGRIPDIFGTVRSTPDLIAAPYKIFTNNKEVEYAYMCVGRGEYAVSDIRDGATLCSNIPGTSVAVYGPYTSPNSGDAPQLQIGAAIPHKVLNTKRSNSVNGQVLRPPNAQTLTTLMRFVWPNVIQKPDNVDDFSKAFVDGDQVTLSGAVLNAGGGSTEVATLAGQVGYTPGTPNTGFVFLLVSSLGPNYVVGGDVTITDISSTQPGYEQTLDLSGTYEIAAIQSGFISSEYNIPTVLLVLVSPELVNADWADLLSLGQVTPNKLLTFEIANPTLSFDLDGVYTIVSVTSGEIVLDDPESVAPDWANLETPQVSPFLEATLETTQSAKWYGPFVLESTDRTSILSNFTAVNGLYKDNGTTQTAESVTVQIEVTPINALDEPIGDPQLFQLILDGSDTLKETVSKTMTAATAAVGRVAVRASRVSESDTAFTGTVVDEVRWKDMYAVSPVDKADFGNVTTVHSITFATASALAVKDRKLNLLATRKIPLRISGSMFSEELTASDDAAEIFSAICRDKYIGRRTPSEMDFDNIYDTVDAIEAYFGSDKVRKFAYTFDSDNLSFEETATQVADVLGCVAYRRGNVIRLNFERQTNDSTLLFNHRNKIPKSERRSVTFGNGHEFDGLEYTYVDPRDDSVISIFLPPDYAATNPKKVESIGVRDHLQAYFLAWRIWQKMLYQNTTVEFDATQEADLLVRNDRILVADGTRPYTQDGEVVAVDGLELTLSQIVDLTVYASYVIFLQHIDGIAESIDISAGSASNKVVLADAPRLALVTDIEQYARTAYVIVGSTEPAQTAFLVVDREPQSNMTSTVKAKNYDARYYAHDLDFINEIIDENGYGPSGGFVPGYGDGYFNPLTVARFTAGNGTVSGSPAGGYMLPGIYGADTFGTFTSQSGPDPVFAGLWSQPEGANFALYLRLVSLSPIKPLNTTPYVARMYTGDPPILWDAYPDPQFTIDDLVDDEYISGYFAKTWRLLIPDNIMLDYEDVEFTVRFDAPVVDTAGTINLSDRTFLVNGYIGGNSPSLRMYTLATTQDFGRFLVAKNNTNFNSLLVDDGLIAGEGSSVSWASTEEWFSEIGEPPDGTYEIRCTRTNEVHSGTPTFNGVYGTWIPLDNTDYTGFGWMWDCFYYSEDTPSSYTADWVVEIRDAISEAVLGTATWSIILNANLIP